jgi:hypothetical protein
MTNEVYQVRWLTGGGEALKEREVRKVLVRVYGDGVELFFDRQDELRTFECMSRHGQGPRLLGRFPNGRVEEFIHARVRAHEHTHRVYFLVLNQDHFSSGLLCFSADFLNYPSFWAFVATFVFLRTKLFS